MPSDVWDSENIYYRTSQGIKRAKKLWVTVMLSLPCGPGPGREQGPLDVCLLKNHLEPVSLIPAGLPASEM